MQAVLKQFYVVLLRLLELSEVLLLLVDLALRHFHGLLDSLQLCLFGFQISMLQRKGVISLKETLLATSTFV